MSDEEDDPEMEEAPDEAAMDVDMDGTQSEASPSTQAASETAASSESAESLQSIGAPVALRATAGGNRRPGSLEVRGVKKPIATRFAPKVTPFNQSLNLDESQAMNAGSTVDLASLLAASLSMKNVQQRSQNLQRQGTGPLAARISPAARAAQQLAAQQSQVSMQSKLQEHLRRMKKTNKTSKTIEQFSFPDDPHDLTVYAPISLPFVYTDTDGQEGTSSSRRPTVKHVDEGNRNAAVMFNESSEDTSDEFNRKWLFVQLPFLPGLDKVAMASGENPESAASSGTQAKPRKDAPAEAYECSCLEGLPEGKIGTIQVHASGKVTWRLGELEFDVNIGSEAMFSQEVGCLLESNNEFIFLGQCNRRMIVTPKVDF